VDSVLEFGMSSQFNSVDIGQCHCMHWICAGTHNESGLLLLRRHHADVLCDWLLVQYTTRTIR